MYGGCSAEKDRVGSGAPAWLEGGYPGHSDADGCDTDAWPDDGWEEAGGAVEGSVPGRSQPVGCDADHGGFPDCPPKPWSSC